MDYVLLQIMLYALSSSKEPLSYLFHFESTGFAGSGKSPIAKTLCDSCTIVLSEKDSFIRMLLFTSVPNGRNFLASLK